MKNLYEKSFLSSVAGDIVEVQVASSNFNDSTIITVKIEVQSSGN